MNYDGIRSYVAKFPDIASSNHGGWRAAILSRKITVDVLGEVAELKNTMQYDGGSAKLLSPAK